MRLAALRLFGNSLSQLLSTTGVTFATQHPPRHRTVSVRLVTSLYMITSIYKSPLLRAYYTNITAWLRCSRRWRGQLKGRRTRKLERSSYFVLNERTK
ncbi:hypothetical protein K443DRAFT_383496 [Laccaria amethystina LaAM-08-1]|uniref:Uncharacterized protein n=1 Tax=Laccaria amethystina LaAM-08-1 TaxID=1095629 RepID=A0A0C9WXJ6_9AGAR|nr:hypothetical protein K443DRAFT_383496 [Laccaria amethystina LaAM-08-1]